MMEKLFDLQRALIEQFEQKPYHERAAYSEFALANRINGIVGSRGVGKTTFLLHHAIKNGAKEGLALYISADNILLVEKNFLDLVDWLYKETKVRLLCVDEIHKYENWNQELKNIYDTYLGFKVLFTGSSAIDLVHSKFDLSRRVSLYPLHGLSFREYLEFFLNIRCPKFNLNEIVKNHSAISHDLKIPNVLMHFKEYLRAGYYPFFMELTEELARFQSIENITQKVIYEDIAVLHNLKTGTLMLIEKLFKYVVNSQPGELNPSKLASALNKDFESISQYFSFLNQAGLIRFLFPNKAGKAYLRNPIKMYPDNSNIVYASHLPQLVDSTLGKIREIFVVNQIQNANKEIYYSEIGDFAVDSYCFEVGGKSKTRKQLKHQDKAYLLADGILTGQNDKIPLYLLGFLS